VDDDSGFQENEVQTVVTTGDGNAMQNLTVHHQLQLHQQQPQSTRPALSSSSETSPPTEKPALKVVVRDFQRLALDNMYAQFAFGMMFLRSKGSIQSDFEALYWFKKAAELGHPEAQFYIGDLYERDRLLRKDIGRAVHWYGKAAEQNHAEAMRRLLALFPPQLMCDQDYTYPPEDPKAPDDQAPRSSGRLSGDHVSYTDDRLLPHAPSKSESNDPSSSSGDSTASDSDDSNAGSGAVRTPRPRTRSAVLGIARAVRKVVKQASSHVDNYLSQATDKKSSPVPEAPVETYRSSLVPETPIKNTEVDSAYASSTVTHYGFREMFFPPDLENLSSAAIFMRMERRLPDIIFFRATIGKILSEFKMPVYMPGERDPAVIDALQKLHVIVTMLSSSGLALSFDSADIKEVRLDLDCVRLKLCRSLGMPDDAINVTEEEQKDTDVVRLAEAKLSKRRSNAKLLFREFKVGKEQVKKFFLDKDNIRLDEIIAEDNISKTFKGEIIAGDSKGKKVHVRQYTEIALGDLNVITQRTIFLTRLMDQCENIARPRFVVPSAKMIVMDPITHMTLDKFLQDKDVEMTKAQKVEIALKIAGALTLVHTFDVLHRDIRASNVLMIESTTSDGQTVTVPKLTGFEICRDRQGDYSRGEKVPKQPMNAPEIETGHGTSLKTDVFAFGVLMYEISMGKSPSMRGGWVTPQDVLNWHSQEIGHLSIPYSELLMSCISFDYEKRPTMKEVAEKLAAIAGKADFAP
ncbi:hypothetical protein DFQ27_009571, partial [Actinomortierella ambigua]